MPPLSLYDQTLARLYGADPSQQQQPVLQSAPGQPSPIQPLTPQEESSVLDKIGGAAASGLGYIGGSLGKAFGGRAIRGLLGGRPEELASIIPFSDTLGITDPSHEVTGAELLGNKNADLLSPEGIGGIAAEILLDPATYLSFGGGAISKLGEAAKNAGVLPKGIGARVAGLAAGTPEADALARAVAGTTHAIGPTTPEQLAAVAGKPLGGHVGVGLPFMGNQATFDLRPVGNALSNALGAVPGGQAIKNLGGSVAQAADPFIRGARALFDKNVFNQTDPFTQDLLAQHYAPQKAALMTEAKQAVRPLVEMGNEAGLLNAKGGDVFRDVLEGATPAGNLQPIKTAYQDLLGQSQKELQGAMLPNQILTPQTIKSGPGAGLPMEYAPRQLAQEVYEGKGARPKGIAPPEAKARIEATEGLTANRLKDLAKEDMSGLNELQVQEKIRTDYMGLPPQVHVDLRDLKAQLATEKAAAAQAQQTMTAAGVMDARKQLLPDLAQASSAAEQQLAKSQATIQATSERITQIETDMAHAADLAKMKVEGKVPQFNNPFEDLATKILKDKERALKADTFHYGVAGLAMGKAEAGEGAIPFLEALKRGGLAPEGNQLMQKTQDALAKWGKNPMALEDMFVKKENLQPLLNFMDGIRTPKGLEPFLNIWDSLTNLTKSFQTAMWPGNWSRNFLTDQYMHWGTGGSATGRQVKDLMDATNLYKGGANVYQDANKIPMFAHLSPEDATKEVQRLIVDHSVTGQGRLLNDTVGEVGEGIRAKNLLPGVEREGPLGQYAQKIKEGTWNPLDVRGFNGREEDLFKPVAAGRAVNESLSDISRIQTFIGKLQQGFAPEQAMEAVVKAHYDFSALSDWERQVMRRVVPFYSWQRANVPTLLKEYAENPGGKIATTTKAAGRARGAEPGFLPPQIGEGVALPIGGEDATGTQRFLSHTGLPFEDLAQMGTGKDILGMLNPLLKGPLEQLTGKQFFTGRDLRDLRSETGFQPLDNLLANSPLGRIQTTRRTLMDERKDALTKAVNILSGTHLSDEDMAKARDVAVRNYISDQLRGQPEIGQHLDLYPRADQIQNLTPSEITMLRLQKTRDAEARQRAKIGVRPTGS